MKRFWCPLAVVVGWGATTVAVMPGCGSGLGEVTVHEVSPASPNSLSAITIERIQECFATHGGQLPPGRHYFNPIIEVDQDGMRRSVKTPDMPDTAPELAACTRIALQDMAIPSSVFNMRATQSPSTNEPTVEQRSLVSNPAVVVIVVVGLGEIAIEAGAYTILFGVSVKVLQKVAEDVAEGGKAHCAAHYAACMATSVAKKNGNHWRQSRCGNCASVCVQNEGSWPTDVGNGSCEYWQPNWK